MPSAAEDVPSEFALDGNISLVNCRVLPQLVETIVAVKYAPTQICFSLL